MVAATISAAPTILFEDDFESYANNTELLAESKFDALNGIAGISAEQNNTEDGNQSIKEDVAGSLTGNFPAYTPTDEAPLVIEVSFFESESSFSGSPRTRSGLTVAAYPSGVYGVEAFDNIINFGPYSSANISYDYRVIAPATDWVTTSSNPDALRQSGWRRLKIEIKASEVTFYVDDEPIATRDVTNPPGGWNTFRLGAFAGAPGVDLFYDDLIIYIPGEEDENGEPTSVTTWEQYQ